MGSETEALATTVEILLARVNELESRAAIRDLVSNYCIGFDTRDWQRFMSIWHEDARWDIGPPFGVFTGHSGIGSALSDTLFPAWRETHHLTTNLVLHFDTPNHARGICDVQCTGATPDDVVQLVGATYTDNFERRNGLWAISARKVDMHYFNPVPGMQLCVPE